VFSLRSSWEASTSADAARWPKITYASRLLIIRGSAVYCSAANKTLSPTSLSAYPFLLTPSNWASRSRQEGVLGKISGSHGKSMKMAVCWNVAPCSLVEIGRRFRGT
jgi:hypothetical protein